MKFIKPICCQREPLNLLSIHLQDAVATHGIIVCCAGTGTQTPGRYRSVGLLPSRIPGAKARERNNITNKR